MKTLAWLVYLVVLSGALLYNFPWRKPSQESLERDISKMLAELPEDKRREALELRKMLDEAARPSFISEFRRYRRMPCWSDVVHDELVADTSSGAGGAISFKFDFAAPVRAWDRFALEMLYGVGLAAFVHVTWMLVRYLRRRRQPTG